MAAFFAPRCPVDGAQQAWIDESFRWLVDRFGRAAVFRRTILPTPEFFPDGYTGTTEEVEALVRRVCRYLDLDPGRVEVEVLAGDEEEALRQALPFLEYEHTGEAGHYRRRDGRGVVTIDGGQARSPIALVATVAHELCHELLIGGDLVEESRKDGEQLTDLLTVYLGLGIFTANAAVSFTQQANGWRRSWLGYLSQPMYGYALARYALLREESAASQAWPAAERPGRSHDALPSWARYLDTNPRVYLKRSLRFLRAHPPVA